MLGLAAGGAGLGPRERSIIDEPVAGVAVGTEPLLWTTLRLKQAVAGVTVGLAQPPGQPGVSRLPLEYMDYFSLPVREKLFSS